MVIALQIIFTLIIFLSLLGLFSFEDKEDLHSKFAAICVSGIAALIASVGFL